MVQCDTYTTKKIALAPSSRTYFTTPAEQGFRAREDPARDPKNPDPQRGQQQMQGRAIGGYVLGRILNVLPGLLCLGTGLVSGEHCLPRKDSCARTAGEGTWAWSGSAANGRPLHARGAFNEWVGFSRFSSNLMPTCPSPLGRPNTRWSGRGRARLRGGRVCRGPHSSLGSRARGIRGLPGGPARCRRGQVRFSVSRIRNFATTARSSSVRDSAAASSRWYMPSRVGMASSSLR